MYRVQAENNAELIHNSLFRQMFTLLTILQRVSFDVGVPLPPPRRTAASSSVSAAAATHGESSEDLISSHRLLVRDVSGFEPH